MRPDGRLTVTTSANTNNLAPDQTTALFVSQAVASALASFGANELEAAQQSLHLATTSTLLIRNRELRASLTMLVQGASLSMLAIDVGAIAAAAAHGEG